MQQTLRGKGVWRTPLEWVPARRVVVVAAAVALAVVILAAADTSTRFGDAPLFFLIVPLGLCAFGFGIRGGVASTLGGSAIASAWWVEHGYSGGWSWFASRLISYALLGVTLGTLVETRRKLQWMAEQHADLSLDLIATANFGGFFTAVNPAFTRTLGYSREELLSRPFIEFVHPDDRQPTIAEVVRQTEAGEEVLHFQNRYLHKDGGYRWLEWTSHPDAATETLVAVARDVTDRKELELRTNAYRSELEQAVNERTAELQQRNAELEEARRETLQRLALAAEFRDDETFEHTERVGRTAAALARAIGLPPETIRLIREAAPLHDVGKLGVSDSILLKPGRLDAAEFEEIKRHPVIGASILEGSHFDVLQLAEVIAASHHEWWDGRGYPKGLSGESIPVEARIVAIADVFDALTHERPYKRAWTIEDALAEIRRMSGVQFDPALVEAFDRLDHRALAGYLTAADRVLVAARA